MANLTVDVFDLEPLIPIEIAPLIEGPATSERLAVSVQAGEAETYSLSLESLIGQLVDTSGEAGGTQFTLKPTLLRNLPLVVDQNIGNAYVVVVAEVLYIRSLEATVRERTDPEKDGGDAVRVPAPTIAQLGPVEPATAEPAPDPSVAAILRAQAMNEAFGESGIEDRSGGSIKLVMATDEALTLRRRWPYPLAVAVRGITLEVEVATGNVLRMGPLGVELPDLPPPPPPSEKPEPEPEPEPAGGQ